MSNDILNEINNLSADELEIIITQKSHLFSEKEMALVKERYNNLRGGKRDDNAVSLSNTTGLSRELYQYGIGDGELDDLTNTRILFRIFKCVNFMKNVLIAGLVCGGIGIVLAAMK